MSIQHHKIPHKGISHVWNNFPHSSSGVEGSQSSSAQIVCRSAITCWLSALIASTTSLHIEKTITAELAESMPPLESRGSAGDGAQVEVTHESGTVFVRFS